MSLALRGKRGNSSRRTLGVLCHLDGGSAEAKSERSIRIARGIACVYWVGIAGLGFPGAVKPF